MNVIIKFKIILSFSLFLTTFSLSSQENLITVNPDFSDDVSGWSSCGDMIFSHDTAGAQTYGSAKVVVNSVDTIIDHTCIKSSVFTIPEEARGKLLFFTFYTKAFTDSEVRVKLWVKDSEGNNAVTKSSILYPDDTYRRFSFPIHTKANSISFNFNVEFGLHSGTYYYDDFSVFISETEIQYISLFDDEWRPKYFKRPDSIVSFFLDTVNSDVTVVINPDSILSKVLYTQFGVNSNFRSRDGLVNRFHLYEQFGAFRFPAGSGSNIYFWDCNIPDEFAIDINTYCGTSSKFFDPDNFLSFRENAKGEPTIVVNYFYARYGITPEGTRQARVQQAADYAASWVNYFNIEKQANVKYWEIGNECYGPWETGYDVNGSIVTGKEYGEDLCVFAEAMKAVDSTIRIGAVLSHSKYEWNNEVMNEVGDAADFLIVHHYSTINDRATAVSAINEMSWDMQELQASAKHYSNKPDGYFPVAFTEFNIQGQPTTSMLNGIFVADALGNIIKNKFFMSTIWVNEWNVNDFETHGIIAKNDPYQADYTARPSYTPYYFYGKCFGDLMIDVSVTGNEDIRIYASTFASGEIGITILNYSETEHKLSINFSDTTKIDSIFWYSVYTDNINNENTKFYVNSLTSNTVGGGPPNLDDVYAYAASFAENSLFTVPRYSVTYCVLKKKFDGNPSGVWNGSFSSDWSTAYNWLDSRLPYSTSNVLISTVPEGNHYPEIIFNDTYSVCKNLTISKNAHFSLPENTKFIIKEKLKIIDIK
jgi:alpha-L-arabinofuranosidase